MLVYKKGCMVVKITYISGNISLVDRIKPLWEELNQQHLSLSPYFKNYYLTLTFQDKKQVILQKFLCGDVRVDLALDSSGKVIGYCVSTVDSLATGEMDSIFVNPHYRGKGIGKALMKKALEWLNNKGVKKKIVSVAVGNEQAYKFYSRFGFFPRRTLLEQKQ